MTALSIIIVSFNARADLERCLESLHADRPAAPHEILVDANDGTLPESANSSDEKR